MLISEEKSILVNFLPTFISQTRYFFCNGGKIRIRSI